MEIGRDEGCAEAFFGPTHLGGGFNQWYRGGTGCGDEKVRVEVETRERLRVRGPSSKT
jgi:hypothetical protein